MASLSKPPLSIEPPPLTSASLTPSQEQPWDGWLLVIVCALMGLGVVMIFSASAITALWRYNDPTYFLKRQFLHMIAGFFLLYVGMQIDYRWYRRAAYPILGVTVGMLLMVLLLGHTAGGAKRWVSLGVMMFQPGEWAKIAMIMVLAYSVEKKDSKIKSFSVGFLPHLVLVGGVVLLLLKQPDFGTSVLIVSMMFVLLFVAGTRLSYILAVLLMAAVGAWQLVVNSEYRMKRIMAFLDPWSHQDTIGYQVVESLIAIGSGRVSGEGLGNGMGKLGFVPALETDFIGTAIAEELGFMGISLVVVLFLLFLWRGLRIAFQARDLFGTYLAVGITVLFGLQAAINLGVISGMLPTKGLTLPFVSYGGSSLLCSMFAVGIMLNISRCADDAWEQKRALREQQRQAERWERKRLGVLDRRRRERQLR
jgi:cell division protein FtsW